MEQEFDFFKTNMGASRQADYYLGCHDSSVFLDFNTTKDNLIYLCRLSFDGYGCCNLDNNSKCLDEELSKEFIEEYQKDILDQEKITRLVLEIIRLNKDIIWNDALEEYNFI